MVLISRTIIASLFEYGDWANEKLLTLAAVLTPEEFERQYSSGYRSIHDNFTHFVATDENWLRGWRGEGRVRPPSTDQLPTVAAIRAKWQPIIEQRRAFIAELTEAQLEEDMPPGPDGEPTKLPLWQAMVHCANHGTQHRSEIAAMLTDAGHSPGDLDFLYFCMGRGK